LIDYPEWKQALGIENDFLAKRIFDLVDTDGTGFIDFHWLNRSQRSYEWFMDLLSEAEQTLGDDRFKLHIHLTSLTHDLMNITGLIAETSAGRPDWHSVFQGVAAAHPGDPVDVYFCGPPALGTVVRGKCRKHGLIYHEEKF